MYRNIQIGEMYCYFNNTQIKELRLILCEEPENMQFAVRVDLQIRRSIEIQINIQKQVRMIINMMFSNDYQHLIYFYYR